MAYQYAEFISPPNDNKLIHIIWNVYLTDKDSKLNSNNLADDKITHIVAIIPNEEIYNEKFKKPISHTIMKYEGHNVNINFNLYDIECEQIEKHRKDRNNVLVFCNNGYQRSLPFLVYYLTKYHSDEVPTVERAIDIILPQVDKKNYSTDRNKIIESVENLLRK